MFQRGRHFISDPFRLFLLSLVGSVQGRNARGRGEFRHGEAERLVSRKGLIYLRVIWRPVICHFGGIVM